MANVAQVLKAEISRISRKETKEAVAEVVRSNRALKKTVAALKRRVASLESESKRLMKTQAKRQAQSPPPPAEGDQKARITSKGVRRLRGRLGLTRSAFAKLVGTTAHSIYLWERKDGALRLRGNTRAALLSIRGLGAREAKRRVAETEPTGRRARSSAAKKRKTG